MSKRILRKTSVCSVILIFILVVFVSKAYSWGSATHAYLDDRLGVKKGYANSNEIYGGMAADVFNFLILNPDTAPYFPTLYGLTHDQSMLMWDAAQTPTEKNLAYGFVSHNDLCGADSTAHHQSLTLKGASDGYVITKARLLEESLDEHIPADLKPYLTGLDAYHNLVEYAVDILMKRLDPKIGDKVVHATQEADYSSFQVLLVTAYGDSVALFIPIAEPAFRANLISYGEALKNDQKAAIELLAFQMAYLASIGLPPELGYSAEDLLPMAQLGIEEAIELCKSDFAREIQATKRFVSEQLEGQGVLY